MLNLDIAGEFLVMAATLIHIKSKMLLPPDETPPEEELIICGNRCFTEGLFYPGLEAYRIAKKTPPLDGLLICGKKCFEVGLPTQGLEAYEMAKKTPTKEMVRACGEKCLLERRNEEARIAFVAAQKIEDTMKAEPIEIKETSFKILGSSKETEESWTGFGPKICMDCENDEEFEERYFILTRCPDNKEEEKWLDDTMKEQYGIEHYCVAVDAFEDDRGLIDFVVCGKCGSQNVDFDL